VTVARPGLVRGSAEAAGIALLAALVGLAANGLRRDGLSLLAARPYETLVPCPEPGGPVTALEAADPAVTSQRSYLIDARGAGEYAEFHLPGAVHVAYDWLDPLPDATLDRVARAVAASRATRVVAYGDGGVPDSGEYLGRELSARGIRNVCFVRGGVAAVRREAVR